MGKMLLSIWGFLLTLSVCNGQERQVVGRVLYADDRSPVPHATVRVDDSMGVVSDYSGNFRLLLPETLKSVKLFVSGFRCVDRTFTLSEVSETPVDILMEPQAYILPMAVATGVRPPRGAVKMIGDTLSVRDNGSGYSLKRGIETGILVKNNRRITLDAIYISIKDTPLSNIPFVLRIRKGPSMKSNRLYDAKAFSDVLPELLICQAETAGILKIDLSRYNLRTRSDFLILLSPASSDPSFEYTLEKPVTEISPAGRMTATGETRKAHYYGATFNAYPNYPKDIYWLVGNQGKYAYSNVSGMEIHPPLIAIGYKK